MLNSSKELVADGLRLPQQFEALAFPLMDRLFSTALRMTRDQHDAEDLVQDTYLKAYRFFHRFQLGTNFRAWMFRILTNHFITEYHTKKRMPPKANFETICTTVPLKENSEFNSDGEFELKVNYEDLFDDTIIAALNGLPEKYRIVVLLSDVNDLKYKEIAKMLDCPIGTVMSRLSRGRKMLTRSLRNYAVTNGFTNN